MVKQSNTELLKFEIKAPDYDLVDRRYVAMEGKSLEPLRYTYRKGEWFAKKKPPLFGKSITKLMFVGDITCFEKQFEESRIGKTYDFSYELAQLSPIFGQADLVVGNLETMIVPFAPYRTEKYVSEQNFHCNAPIEFLEAVKNCGIDMVTNANNHDMDTGAQGIGETIDNIEKMGLIHTGTFKTDKPRFELITVGGIKIAVIAFATEHNNKRSNLTAEGIDFLLNDYSKKKAADLLAQARAKGAELVFTCIHWGKEHKLVQNSEQEDIAKELALMGYDCIIGSHPHVLQPFEYVSANGKQVPVFYSMGNFLSHNTSGQRSRSIIACVDIVKKKNELKLECSYIPIFTSRNFEGRKFVVLPIVKKPQDELNKKNKKLIEKVVGNVIDINSNVEFKEVAETPEEAPAKKIAPVPNLRRITQFPVKYDDGKFIYEIYEDYVQVAALSEIATQSSYSIPVKFESLPVEGINPEAFKGNQVMKKINFGGGIESISPNACRDCIYLEGFQLGRKTLVVCESAFEGCVNLAAAVMKFKVKKIGERAFAGCVNLRTVKIPPNVTAIADNAFEGCASAVFYCEAGSYALQWATEHGFKTVIMELND